MGNTQSQGRSTENATQPKRTSTTLRSFRAREEEEAGIYRQNPLAGGHYKSKTLPVRSSSRRVASDKRNSAQFPSSTNTLPTDGRQGKAANQAAPPPNGETSRVLFLLYLIHRTWNVVVETVDTRSKRSRRTSSPKRSDAKKASLSSIHDDGNFSMTITDGFEDPDDMSSNCYSQYSSCSCSYCYEGTQNVYNSIGDNFSLNSRCDDSDLSTFYRDNAMAPSLCQNSPKLQPPGGGAARNVHVGVDGGGGGGGGSGSTSSLAHKSHCGDSSLNGSMASYKMSSSENSWPQAAFSKENQRPPVYNPEDYAQSLKKFKGRLKSGDSTRSIYDANDTLGPGGSPSVEGGKSSTLPNKHSEYKSPIPAPQESVSEMSLRQFASITDLLTKLRADLRVSFPSFVQEFVAMPSDGVSLLLEVLRAIQLSQATNNPLVGSMPRNAQTYQRRALLDELACLQCLSICSSRSVDATARLGSTPIGLMPLASSATGQGIRARILAMQLMTAACDKNSLGPGSQKAVQAGHVAVSDAMSTLRLRCSEPVRFRLLIGMMNSGGGSGELQAVGVKFLNSFLESSENLQQRLYLQAELFQAGFEPATLAKTISSSSPWIDNLKHEIKRFNELYVDVDKMLSQARDAERVRSQMVILERRVQILHEEKAVLTSMERRLQERCAELQREIFRLQGAQNGSNFKSLDKQQPVALPRHVPPTHHSKQDSSEHEDEGISSSETGPSLSPVPILVLPQQGGGNEAGPRKSLVTDKDDDRETIEHVIGELDQIVDEAEKQMKGSALDAAAASEKEIIPVNIVPQPPRKSRSLSHLVNQAGNGAGGGAGVVGSDLDDSDYGLLLQGSPGQVAAMQTFFDESDYNLPEPEKPYNLDGGDIPEVNTNAAAAFNANTTRELLDVIMNARHSDDDPTIKAFRDGGHTTANHHHSKRPAPDVPPAKGKPQAPAQHFNGVFFMTGMNKPQKYPKPDLSAALQAKRVTKNVERLEAAFASHESLNEATKVRNSQQIYFGSNPTLRLNTSYGSYTNNVTVINEVTTRTRSYTHGSKVTDIPSGMY